MKEYCEVCGRVTYWSEAEDEDGNNWDECISCMNNNLSEDNWNFDWDIL